MYLLLVPISSYMLLLPTIAVVVTVGYDIKSIDTISIWIIYMEVQCIGYVLYKLKRKML